MTLRHASCAWLVPGAALILAAAAGSEPAAPAPTYPAAGLVDRPCPAGTSGRTPAEEAFGRPMVADGPMDPAALKAFGAHAAERAAADAARSRNDWADLCRYRDADDALIAHGGAKVVFLGDSTTELWRQADPGLFTGGIVDRGISGQTSGQALLRVYSDVVDLHPRAVHIMIGINDMAGNTGPSRPDDLKNNISGMVDIAKAHRIQIILASILPAAAFPGRSGLHPARQVVEMNLWLRELATREGLIYVDYNSVLASPSGGMRDGYSRDGLHPLSSGYALMRPLAQAVEQALTRASQENQIPQR